MVDRSQSAADVVAVIHHAFAERKPPAGAGFHDSEEGQAVERHLAGVGAFDLTCDVVESYRGDERCLFSRMYTPTRAYYLPSFMLMAVEDFARSEWHALEVLRAFRYWPFGWPLWPLFWREKQMWTANMRRLWLHPRRKALALRDLGKWFHEGYQPSRNGFIGCLTDVEQQAVLAFFAHLQAVHPDDFEDSGRDAFDARNIAAAKSMISGGDLLSRLAVRSRTECLSMREVLRILRRRYPNHAPAPAEAEEIDRELTLAAEKIRPPPITRPPRRRRRKRDAELHLSRH